MLINALPLSPTYSSAEERLQPATAPQVNDVEPADQETHFGSSQSSAESRFQSAIAKLALEDSLSQAKSRIVDTDFAQETSTMTKNQILAQAGVAMLAQANSMPQIVLALLDR